MKLPVIILLSTLGVVGCRETPCEADPNCLPVEPCVGAGCGGSLAEPVETLSCRTPNQGELQLNEVLADPSGVDVNGDGEADSFDDEFVEILNTAEVPLNVEGVTLKVNGKVRLVMQPQCVEAHRPLVVFGGGNPQASGLPAIVSDSSLKLTNTGATISLFDGGGQLLDSLTYDDEADGPQSLARMPDGVGEWTVHSAPRDASVAPGLSIIHSAGRCNTGGDFPTCDAPNSNPDDGSQVVVDPPTTRADEPKCRTVETGELLVNEVLADPGGFDSNGDGTISWREDEFVEVVLVSSGDRDLTGVVLTVGGTTKATFPAGCHAPRTAFVIFGGGTVSSEPRPGVVAWLADKQLTLSNAGTSVAVVLKGTAAGAPAESRQSGDTVLDEFIYGPEGGKDHSLTRYPDGRIDVGFYPHTAVSTGLTASPGRCSNMMAPRECLPGEVMFAFQGME